MADTKRIMELLDMSGVFYLTTLDGDAPRCRPISFKMERDGKVWFGVGTYKDVYKQLQANPNAEICGMVGQNFLRYWGTATFDDDPTLVADALEVMPMLKGIYNEETGNRLGMFYLADATCQVRDMFNCVEEVEA